VVVAPGEPGTPVTRWAKAEAEVRARRAQAGRKWFSRRKSPVCKDRRASDWFVRPPLLRNCECSPAASHGLFRFLLPPLSF
jgi:hypothetical protein